MKEQALLGRIMGRINIEAGGCWIWTGRTSRNGYGRISVRNTERAVHRVMFMLFGGVVFDGEVIDHRCRNRACCNPEHLEAVSVRENTRRGDAGSNPRDEKGRWCA